MKLPEQVEVEGVEHTSVPVDGFDAHVALGGPPAGEPVILLHGWPLHWCRSATSSAGSPTTAAA
jgi:hypothetical protein